MGVVVGGVEEATLIVRALVATSGGCEESETDTVKLEVPALLGVPEITPPDDRVSPAGRDPEAMLHTYGAIPPLADRVAEYEEPAIAALRPELLIESRPVE